LPGGFVALPVRQDVGAGGAQIGRSIGHSHSDTRDPGAERGRLGCFRTAAPTEGSAKLLGKADSQLFETDLASAASYARSSPEAIAAEYFERARGELFSRNLQYEQGNAEMI
jgi:hypothetical protein